MASDYTAAMSPKIRKEWHQMEQTHFTTDGPGEVIRSIWPQYSCSKCSWQALIAEYWGSEVGEMWPEVVRLKFNYSYFSKRFWSMANFWAHSSL